MHAKFTFSEKFMGIWTIYENSQFQLYSKVRNVV